MSAGDNGKPWYAEREFVMSSLGVIVGFGLIFIGERDLGVTLITGSIAGFSVSRGLAKGGNGKTS